jgi:hypothetical protein
MKKIIRVLVLAAAFAPLGCDLIPAPIDFVQNTVSTTIGFTFGRLLVSSILSSQGNK